MSTYIIYKTTNLVNGKIYVGQHLIQPETSANDNYLGSGCLIQRSIKKYGKENFKREILEFCEDNNINQREIFWINELNSNNLKIGYNIANGGEGGDNLSNHPDLENIKIKISNAGKGRKFSEETRKKMSFSQKGRVISKNHRDKIRDTLKGRHHSEETKIKLSEISKKRKGWHHNKETILKISQSKLGKKLSNETKIKMSNNRKGILNSNSKHIDMNKILEMYNNHIFIKDIAKNFNVSIGTIYRRLNNINNY
jgi:group I intron endonuclease